MNATRRRTVNPRFSTVVAASSREFCCAAHPASIASSTASSGCRNDTPAASIAPAEPGSITGSTARAPTPPSSRQLTTTA